MRMYCVIYKFDEKNTMTIDPKFISYVAVTTFLFGLPSETVNFFHLLPHFQCLNLAAI